jgi:hypothetical protein
VYAQKKQLSTSRIFRSFDSKCTAWCWGKLFLPHLKVSNNKQQTTSEEQMKFNKWTLGLAAIGAVSLATAARAEETKPLEKLNTAISNTTISGVVDVGAQWNMGNVHDYSSYYYGGNGNSGLDAFTVNQVIISLDKPLDESPWASGYHIDLNWGSSAVTPMSTTSYYGEGNYSFSNVNPLRQAYVTLRTPVGNGIDWKAGLFDNILGYEANTLSVNPNYSHSYGWGAEPTSQLGLIGTYKVCDAFSFTGGLANSMNSYSYGYYNSRRVSDKTYLAAATLTAPESWGWAKGAALTLGVNQGFYKNTQNNYYAGLTLPTPVNALKVGFAFDLVRNTDEPSTAQSDWIVGAYASFQATDKLSLNLRGEYQDGYYDSNHSEEVTLTAAYNLWANVVSRVEFRWDHAEQGNSLGYYGPDLNTGSLDGRRSDDFTLAFNVAYQF